jgi:prepilin-type N-terminal cleavage/methylation domain-containing protein
MHNKNKAFSLIELAIVITVIAILTTMVIATKKTMHNAKVISFIDQIEKYKFAYEIFVDKYGSPPGDIADADNLFTNATNIGNDDGFIAYASSTSATPSKGAAESNAAWQHLKLAGLISGNFSGTVGGSAGTEYPECALLQDCSLHFSSVNIHQRLIREQNYIVTALNSGSSLEVIPVKDAYNLDLKIDDGLPYNGWINGISTTSNCSKDLDSTWSSNLENADYLNNNSNCIMIFALDLPNFTWK